MISTAGLQMHDNRTFRSRYVALPHRAPVRALHEFSATIRKASSLGPITVFFELTFITRNNAALHLLAAIANALILEQFEDDWAGRYEVNTPVLKTVDGHLAEPDAPGLGVDMVEETVARYPSTDNLSAADSPVPAPTGAAPSSRSTSTSIARARAPGRRRREPPGTRA